MTLARRASQWLRIVAERRGVTVATLKRDLHTAPNLAIEVAQILDSMARDDAAQLLRDKKPLPDTVDWMTRRHYERIKVARDAQERKEQEQAWGEYFALQVNGK